MWATERLLDQARTLLFPIYASLVTPWWLRALGAKVGRDVEASTVLLLPAMTSVADGAFLADDTMVAGYELARGWVHIAPAKIGKRAFLGNSGMTAPGRRVPKHGLVAVLSAAPQKSKAGSSWLGSPPVRLRRPPQGSDDERTFAPPLRLKVIRGLVELCRILPVMVTVAIATSVLIALQWLVSLVGLAGAAALGGVVLTTRRSRRRRRDDARRSGSSSAASVPSSTRCGAPSSGATRSSTPSSRWSPVRGSRGRRPARPPSTSGCAASGHGSGTVSGARPTGCPRRTS